MITQQKGDLKFIQKLNRSIIFNTIRKKGPISRSEIAKLNSISPTTVSSAVNELIKSELVEEGESGESNGGRRPILVQFSPNNHFIIGISISNSMITIGKLNLEPKVYYKNSFKVDNRKGKLFIDYLLIQIEALLSDIPNIEKCVGISVSVSGIVDNEKGIIRYNSKIELEDVHLKDIIEKRFNLDTWLENDTNALALFEKEVSGYNDSEKLLYIQVDDGIGAAFIFDGTIFRGSQGGVGELGHTVVKREGILCDCGNRGCMERYISWPAIYTKILDSEKKQLDTKILDMVSGDLSKITPSVIIKAWEQGDKLAEKIIEDIVSHLSFGIVNIVNLINPSTIILDGSVLCKNEKLLEMIQKNIKAQGLNTNTEGLAVCYSSVAEDSELIGVANVLLHDKFANSLFS